MASKRTVDNDFARSYVFKCKPCFRKDERNSVQAIKFCEDCLEYLCSGCVHDHNKFGLMKGHTLLNSDEMRSFHSMPCKVHPRNMIDRYCGYHAVVFCPDCEEMYHSSCRGISYLPTAAKRVKSDEYNNLMSSMLDIKLKLEQTKKANVEELERLQQDKYATMYAIQDFTNRMIKHLTDLETTKLDELISMNKELVDKINESIDAVDKCLTSVEENIKKIETYDGDTKEDLLLFVNGFMGTDENYRKQIKLNQEEVKTCIKFKVNNDTNRKILSLNSLGTLATVDMINDYTISHQGDYDMECNDDTNRCGLNGLCQLDDGTIVVVDCYNKKLKRLDNQFRVRDHCVLPDYASLICTVGTNKVAVVQTTTFAVQFVTIGESMELSRSLDLGFTAGGLGYMEGQLFVSISNAIYVYDDTGTRVRVLGQNILNSSSQIAINANKSLIYVADKKRVVSVDMHSRSYSVFIHKSMKDVMAVCVGPEDTLFVADFTSKTIFHISSDGIKYNIVLKETDMIGTPAFLTYDKVNSRLIVILQLTGIIKVYNVLRKDN